MTTQFLNSDDLDKAAAFIKAGELVAFPTETVYGLGASIFNPDAIQKIFQVKGRPSDNPLIAHIADLSDLSRIAIDIPDDFYRLSAAFFPGPLTLVLKRHPQVPALVSAGLDTIAVRQPSHPIAQALIRLVGDPLVAPSANLSGKPSSTNAQHVLEDFSGKIAAVIEGGSAEIGIESTVVSLTHEPTLLRLGQITAEEIEAVLGRKLAKAGSHTPIASPGMKYRHYAPLAKVLLFPTLDALRASLDTGKKQWIVPAPTPQNLYAELRRADLEGCQEVLIHLSESTSPALRDRILRASV